MDLLKAYPFEIRPLTKEDGGGFLISFPDFAECISDGDSVEEAIKNGREALNATIAALKANNFPVPTPNRGAMASGRFVTRLPKTLHAQLAMRAKKEGVSLNSLVLSLISEAMGRHALRS